MKYKKLLKKGEKALRGMGEDFKKSPLAKSI